MTGEDLNNKFDAVLNEFPNTLGEIMIGVGSDALMKIRQRIITSGQNAEGGKYPEYSATPMLANCSSMTTSACKSIAGSKIKRRELKWITLKRGERNIRLFELPGGYKQYRNLHGRQTGYVDFSLSGRMWTNIKLISDNSEHNRGVARIGATTEEDNAKLAGNTARKGDILKVSQDELSQLEERAGLKLVQLFEKHGLK